MRSHAARTSAVLAAVALLGVTMTACAAPGTRLEKAAAPHAGHNIAGTVPVAALRAGERFEALTMARPYTPVPPNGGTDEYRCFLIDPHFTQPTFVTGSQFLPQNPEIVHHAILFRVDPADIGQAKARDAQDPGDGWTCFGGTGIQSRARPQLGANAGWIGSWAPGVSETLIGARTGYRLDAGSQIVMQVHYNLLATNGKAAGADRSGIRLRLADASADIDPLQTTLLAAPIELPCTAAESGPLCDRSAAVADVGRRFGTDAQALVGGLAILCNRGQLPPAGPTQHCDQKVRQAGIVHAVAGHMHLLGRSVKVELNPGTAGAQTLLDVPVYNFDDQGARTLATPVTVKPGDTLRVTCTHDAALRSQLPALRPLKPRYVVWGDGTSDEMCLGVVIWSRPS